MESKHGKSKVAGGKKVTIKGKGKSLTVAATPTLTKAEQGTGEKVSKAAKKRALRKKKRPFPFKNRVLDCIKQHDLKRYTLYKITSVAYVKEYPGFCEFLGVSPEATQMQIAKALMQQPEFTKEFKIFKAGENFLMGKQVDLFRIVYRAMYVKNGVQYEDLLGQMPVSKLELDRFLREQIGKGRFLRGCCSDDQKKWYPSMPRIEKPVVDIWKYALNYFGLFPEADFIGLVGTIKKRYPEIYPPYFTMRRVMAELGHEGKLKYAEGKWTVLVEGFEPDREYLKRDPKLGKPKWDEGRKKVQKQEEGDVVQKTEE